MAERGGRDLANEAIDLPLHAAPSPRLVRQDTARLDCLITDVDEKIGRQLDEILHRHDFQRLEAAWRGLKFLVDQTDFRKNVKIEVLDVSKDALRQDFEDAPDVIQSGLFWHTYTQEYDTPGADPISALISDYAFDHGPQDMALLRDISKVSAAAHMPFIGAVSPQFFGKASMEEVASIRDLGEHFERAEYLRWKTLRKSEDARYLGLTLPRFLARLPYGPDTTRPDTARAPAFNYVEDVEGGDQRRYLWANASFAFATNLVRSFIRNGWCIQIRGPQAGGLVEALPTQLYDLGAGRLGKIPTEALIAETREFQFAHLGLIALSHYKNHDYACFYSAHSVQEPETFDTKEASANSRVNARLPYIFLLSRIAHCLKMIQRENIGTTKDRRLLELELNTWVKTLVTEMTKPGDDLQAAHPLRDARVEVEDIDDNPGFFRVKLFIVPHFQIEGMEINLGLISQMPRAKS
ncbi:EvpB family type VI secretion protein [Caballeronia catudaia]|uniref:EvpB family type VI secretion protein n=2 Tax=Caballeronia catudaia TaxID=1777136 RepID=A0A158DQF9_9BURK|nr:type VI secretion system contractile sheath large subunit [Caballeronia catudaia]SAK96650.1 EvpB family type VI secretion protein [Caballeronia catudaia]